MTRHAIESDGYGSLIIKEDYEGEWVKFADVVKMVGNLSAGKKSTLYRCRECLGLFDDDKPAEYLEEQPTILYCPDCFSENISAAEESSQAYFDRYIAGDK